MASTSKKTVLITGCTPGGIGHELALAFHRQGLHVIATARRLEVLSHLSTLGIDTLPLDVTKSESINACRKQVEEKTGGTLDILVNNAGCSHTIPAVDIDIDDVRNTFETNVFGIMAMVKGFAPLLIASRGLIVNISSIASVTPYIFGSVFCATKGAINSYSRTLRQELRPFGVRVTVVMAGFVKTSTTKVYRQLPPESIYHLLEELFTRKLTYSANTANMEAKDFAEQLVPQLLRGRGWPWGLIGGRPDWLWIGGSATIVRLARWFGEWLLDNKAYEKFGLPKLEEVVREQGTKVA
ncbi:short chain dehydrogenase [Dactylonectria estremocensis]|uniref:Short chain dehydrogenase n=1 Tax=Dactylonectria estremocensis TaxID=1079267 RepID=A0A9P9FF97_9HYPO|nr:short chain dehydrogenase [Dactylonectria estremocensis]